MAAPKKKSLIDAVAPSTPASLPESKEQSVLALSSTKKRPPSRKGKSFVGGYFDPAAAKELKKLAIDLDISQEAAIAQALNMLLASHGKPPVF
ncbi:MAG: hypothetical protein DCF15_14575 [Phormidesmis priestleyi]|uniref:Antitoxin-like ribbon-helix-helix domain-containing protein n=1 Tax=Phormidesmis priestleyi TaxID=268141 RepID=A0A2W4YXX8_9CYAN|nr:MAG: hypothetical protein DCF15_14575 [Phormidesmis priestleyi]